MLLRTVGGGAAPQAVDPSWMSLGPLLPISLALIAVAIANELFAYGIATYQGSVVKK
jgi:hypothetical protein